jgi:hypothetical protein
MKRQRRNFDVLRFSSHSRATACNAGEGTAAACTTPPTIDSVATFHRGAPSATTPRQLVESRGKQQGSRSGDGDSPAMQTTDTETTQTRTATVHGKRTLQGSEQTDAKKNKFALREHKMCAKF